VHRSCVHFPLNLDFDTLYRTYWQPVVRFCAAHLASCPDGTTEEVAQDVFLAAHHALTSQQYRGEGSVNTWLFGIARNRCANARRDTYRHNTPVALRRLDSVQQVFDHDRSDTENKPGCTSAATRDARDQACLAHEREWLARRVLEALYPESPIAPETHVLRQETSRLQQRTVKRLARLNQPAYALLHMHLIKGVSVRELAVLQGMSRSVIQRRLVQARLALQDIASRVDEVCL
jgi:RNA polymerase sigma factor (sigma-70 family)